MRQLVRIQGQLITTSNLYIQLIDLVRWEIKQAREKIIDADKVFCHENVETIER